MVWGSGNTWLMYMSPKRLDVGCERTHPSLWVFLFGEGFASAVNVVAARGGVNSGGSDDVREKAVAGGGQRSCQQTGRRPQGASSGPSVSYMGRGSPAIGERGKGSK